MKEWMSGRLGSASASSAVFVLSLVASACTSISIPEVEDRLQTIQFHPNMYVVQAGDTMAAIAFRYNMPAEQLATLNPEVAGGSLIPGQRLNVRPGTELSRAVREGGMLDRTAVARRRNREASVPAAYPAVAQEPVETERVITRAAPGQSAMQTTTLRDADRPAAEGGEQGQVDTAAAEAAALFPRNAEQYNEGVSGDEANETVIAEERFAGPPSILSERPMTIVPASGKGIELAPTTTGSGDLVVEEVAVATGDSQAMPPLRSGVQIVAAAPDAALANHVSPVPANHASPAPDNDATQADPDADLATGTWPWPLDGQVARGFYPNARTVTGIGIAGVPGQNVHVTAAGVVEYVGKDMSGAGNLVIVRHPGDLLTEYSHVDELFVARGETVQARDPIATLGANEQQQSILDYSVSRNGVSLNPMHYLISR
ncbi:MAG: hypothetical protein CSB44_02895 [Gammaproteobacteria bacterium]|nr:MAG: hypothetical protein CSB44_02895 [Gammaproteobacteria bacterium]